MTDRQAEPVGQRSDIPELDEEQQRSFFDHVVNCALAAEQKVGRLSHDIIVADIRIRLCFAGERLASEFMPALGHLITETAEPCDAIFHIWDGESTGVAMVPPPCPKSAFTSRGDIWGMSSRRYRSAFHYSEYSVCVLDTETGTGSYWVDTAAALPYWAKSSPLRTMFGWLLERHGLFLLHAAVVGDEHGGLIITGKGGVGKSTSSLMALTKGMAFAGDDYVVVSFRDGPKAHCLYSTAKVVAEQLAFMPELGALMNEGQSSTDEKAVLYLHPAHRDRIAQAIPLKWMVTPRFGSEAETGFEPISGAELHQAAAFTTMSQLPHAGQATYEFIGALVRQLQTARIVLGSDPHKVPGGLRALLSGQLRLEDEASHTTRPLISVIIPVYNGAAFLASAVQSILEQHYPAIEIIVIDDGSEEDIEAETRALPVDIRFFRQDNAGPASARNRGIQDAAGELIAFLDVDDLWPAGHLETLLQALDEETDIVIGRGQVARMHSDKSGKYDFVGNPEESFPYYLGAALYRKSTFRSMGLFDTDLRFGEDTDWFLRARDAKLTVKRLDQVTLIVRRHGDNMTNGRSLIELNPLHVFKKALDRRRGLAI